MSIEINGVTINLPIYATKARSLRRQLTTATVGGALLAARDDTVFVRALDNIFLQISDGQRVGLVGRNGSGKTTLLRLLAGVYTPSIGNVTVRGRVSAALDNSLGMDVDITGRENIYTLGYYRGYSKAEISDEIEAIVEVAELGRFIDLPVRTYSAGMMARLIFAVSTAFEPDVLLLDEWLLAGDANFMAKAHERATSYVQRARIMVLASHSTETIRHLCTHVAFLRAGQLVAYGPTDEVLAAYDHEVQQAAFV
jgi:ABC-type polysaccharide/polyol phosphate transport system ATPase subunit